MRVVNLGQCDALSPSRNWLDGKCLLAKPPQPTNPTAFPNPSIPVSNPTALHRGGV
jgi:hypothetical protein